MRRLIPIVMLLCFVAVGVIWLSQTISDTRAQGENKASSAAGVKGSFSARGAVRSPAVAGAFYPASAEQLAAEVAGYLAAVPAAPAQGRIVGAIVPHAGYVYSGPVAAHAYAALKGSHFDTVVVLGPSHRFRFAGGCLPAASGWSTPLGRVSVDTELRDTLAVGDDTFFVDDEPHAEEHSIEVQLPFLQTVLEDFRLLPVLVGSDGEANLSGIASGLAAALKDRAALLVASTDLSHYPAYEAARTTDAETLEIIAQWDMAGLISRERKVASLGVAELHCALCGLGPVVIAMDAGRRLGANTVSVLNVANSGDAPGGDKSRCVGYGAVVLREVQGATGPKVKSSGPQVSGQGDAGRMHTSEGELTVEQQEYLLELARQAVNAWVGEKRVVKPTRREGVLGQDRAVFVTLREEGQLRGCIGSLEPQEALVDAVVSRAIAAATQDPRFSPVTKRELGLLQFHVSVLSPVRPVKDASEIEIGRHGIIVTRGYHSGVFLPEVATEQGWDRETTLDYLCEHKAGLPRDAWRRGAELSVFETQNFGDGDGE